MTRGKGEGSVYKRKRDGQWVGSVALEPGLDGKRRRRVVYGRTRREALAKMDVAREELRRGIEPIGPRSIPTISALVDEWVLMADIQARQRELTRRHYGDAARTRIVAQIGHLPITMLTADCIERWQAGLLTAGFAPRSVWKARVVLSAIIRLARRKGLLHENPLELIDAPPAQAPSKRAISGEQVRRLFEAARGHRFEPIILAAILTGARRGELLGLAWKDVDLIAGTAQFRQQVQRIPRREGLQIVEPKTAASTRSVPLAGLLVERLRLHRQEQADLRDQALRSGGLWANTDPATGLERLVFTSASGTPIEPRNFDRVFKAIIATAGLTPLTPHELRHSLSTILMALGVPPVVVSQILGHADPSVTLRWYSHVIPEAQREAVNRMDEYIRKLTSAPMATSMAI